MFSQLFKKFCPKIFLFLLFISPIISQQKYNFEHISIPDGLSNNSVWDIIQDKYGFLWISTQDGLNRYDGYNFKIFKNDPSDKTSLPNNSLHGLLIDEQDNLWVCTESGLCKYDRASESFITLLPDSGNSASPANVIYKIFEDSKNRMWVGTTNGIYLFDRETRKFELAYIKNGDNKTPTSNLTNAFLETSSGDIYSGYYGADLIKYNEKLGLFERIFIPQSKKWTLQRQPIINLFEDKTGKIWITHPLGLFTYETHTGEFDKIKLNGSAEKANFNPLVTGIYQGDDGYLWISTGFEGLYRYNLRTNKISKIEPGNFPQGVSQGDGWFNFFKDSFGVFWIGSFGNGLLKLDFQKEPFRLYEKPGGNNNTNNDLFILAILKNKANNDIVWLGTNKGLFKYNLRDKSYKKFSNIKGNKNSLPSNTVTSIVQLDEKGLWIGTGNGLSYFNIANNSFANYDFFKSTDKYKISFNNINNITPDDFGNLWLGNGNGLTKFDTKTKSYTIIPEDNWETYDQEILAIVDSLFNNNSAASSILKVGDYQDLKKDFTVDKSSNFLIVSVGEGPTNMADYGWLTDSDNDTLFNMKSELLEGTKYLNGNYKNRIKIETLTLGPGKYKLNYHSDDSHSYGKWNADAPVDSAWWGIQVFSISDNDFSRLNNLLEIDKNKPVIYGYYVRTSKYSKDGNLYLGNNFGLSKYSISQNKVQYLPYGKNIPNTTNTKNVSDMLIDNNGMVWLATDGGLIRYDPEAKNYNIFLDKDGLPSNYVESLQEDNYGNLWIGTYNGISKFNKDVKNPIFINYDVKDGLQSYTFTRKASFKSDDGELFFAGSNGFNAFHSGNINKQEPIIDISEMKINNKVTRPNTDDSPLTKSILDTKNITLDYSQNNISFEFTAIHYSRPEKNQYAYRLDGFDNKGWIYDNRRFATYTNLPPGDYVFRVIGSNSDGIWNEKGASINITVLPPWWRTYWAYALYFVIFAGLVFSVDRVQRRRLLFKEKQAAAIKEAELRARIAEAANERKTKELEEARQLQLSMLPKNLPSFPNLDIAVYMKTATEVGGDYYDFNVSLDGTLTIVLGDATGHGMKAGTMVTSAKTLFNSYAANPDILFTFREMTRCIKQMQFHSLAMCMTMLKIKKNKMLMSAAGMPPVYLFRRENRVIEEHLMKGMPLGTMESFPYELKEMELLKGDTILLMSDGYPELQNDNNEIFGYRRAKNSFEEVAEKEPEEIINHLRDEGSRWVNDKEPDDDVTFVVIKIK